MPVEPPAISLSVVIPTHNVGPWIEETLRSVLAQDLPDMEIIVVDDASEDDTLSLVNLAVAEDSRVRLIRAAARGGGSARNRGVQEARGRYIAFCDGDDLVPAGAYRALVDSLEASGSDIAFGDFLKFSPTDTWRPTATMAAFSRPAQRRRLVDEPTLILSRPCWNKVFRRDFWVREALAFPDVPRSNDIVPMTQAYVRAGAVDIIDSVVYLYRERPGSTSMTARADSTDSMLSYLTQELACARLISAMGDEALTSTYSRLIWDRDGFVHVAKFASAQRADDDRERRAAELLRELLTYAGPPPSSVGDLKVLTMSLGAQGRWAAAKVAGEWETGFLTPDLGDLADFLRAYTTLVETPRRAESRERVGWLTRRALQADIPERRDAGLWAYAAETAGAAFGRKVLDSIADLDGGKVPLLDVVPGRAQAGGVVRALRGGSRLTVEGQSDLSGAECEPVLWDLSGKARVVVPSSVSWSREVGEGHQTSHWQWTADYRRTALPLLTELQPCLRLRQNGRIVSIDSRPPLPEYSVFDSFIYERHRDVVVLYRRRGRVFRAVRRALIIVAAQLRRLVRPRGA
ncbi:glycosyltransferase family 2 protein [Microbacterium sp. NPDC077184]|uniref:glycosyltransferase family 2 protein n=1 Tax=Microbacterium sp. NPDC077184 TaxID=3154764 RepID=UPI003425A91E